MPRDVLYRISGRFARGFCNFLHTFPVLTKPLPLGATATTAASGGNREELLGPRPAGCERERSRRWEPQPGQWHAAGVTERARMLTVIRGRSDSIALTKSLLIAAWAVLSCRACPLRRFAPALPKGEPLAGRATSYWTPKARYGAKGRALLTGTAASGQAHLVKLSLA